MRAAVCYEPGKPLIIEDIDIDPPQSGEVKVRLVATAICHSDIHAYMETGTENFLLWSDMKPQVLLRR